MIFSAGWSTYDYLTLPRQGKARLIKSSHSRFECADSAVGGN